MTSPAKPTDAVVLINRILANEQGRDKMNKVIQYGSRFMMWYLLTSDPKSDWGTRFKLMFVLTRDCRKILRLFKWVNEYEKLEKLLQQPSSHQQQLQIIGTIGMAAYWFFDNATYLVKGGVIANDDRYAKLSMLGWWVGISCSMIIDTRALMDNINREKQLRVALDLPPTAVLDLQALAAYTTTKPTAVSLSSSSSESSYPSDDLSLKHRKELVSLYNARLNLLLSFIKNGGDWLISANGSDLIKQVLGYSLNDGVMGVAGTISGLAVIAQVYRSL